MKSNLLKETIRQFDEHRLQEEAALRAREAEVMEKIPELASLRNASISNFAKEARARILDSTSKDDKDYRQEVKEEDIENIRRQEKKLLVDNAYPEDYLSIRFSCKICKDTGYTGDLVKEKCTCLIQKLIEQFYNQSNLTDVEGENFATFDENVFPDKPLRENGPTQREYMLQLRKLFTNYSKEFPNNPKKNILFTGKTGLGKTFLLNCLAKALLDKGFSVLKITSYNLFEQLFDNAMRNRGEGDQLLKDRIFTVDVLIIDDVGTETKRNNITAEDLFNILNERYLRKKHTFISTNLTLQDLQEWYSDRVTSRLFDKDNTMLIRFSGQDIRLKKKNK
ncbi:MAG TPA: ATP-binding protein [Bacillota bacterium]|nr:ATP-binding protein [Bacillota bacterium]